MHERSALGAAATGEPRPRGDQRSDPALARAEASDASRGSNEGAASDACGCHADLQHDDRVTLAPLALDCYVRSCSRSASNDKKSRDFPGNFPFGAARYRGLPRARRAALVLGSRDFISDTDADHAPPRSCATLSESQIASVFAAAERSPRLR